jgi:hypothetical protein
VVALFVVGHHLADSPNRLRPADDPRLVATDDTYVLADRPDLLNGRAPELVAGGDTDGAATGYLRFRVGALAGLTATHRMVLELTRSGDGLPSTVELNVVAADWAEGGLTGRTAPAMGARVAVAHPHSTDPTVRFDVTRTVNRPGDYAFALTVPPGEGQLAVHSREAGSPPVLKMMNAELTTDPATTAPLPEPRPRVTPSPVARSTSSPPPAQPARCVLGPKLVPTCGVLWGVAPGGHTDTPRDRALREFEAKTGRTQAIYHSYHRGTGELFPTTTERGLAREPGRERLLLVNWKPTARWADIARGDPDTERFLDRLAVHIGATFPGPFFLTIHHEPEDDVRPRPDSGYTARDYAAMFRHVVEGLRRRGATNVVSVLTHMAYPPWNIKPWFGQLYPGDDVVDWIAFDTYAYSEPGYGYGDVAEMLNRRIAGEPTWPGFYAWAARRHPAKPIMVAEWGVWYSDRDPGHQARFYAGVGAGLARFPRIKALVHFDTPSDQRQRDSRVDATPESLRAYRALGALPMFQVTLRPSS